jgi:hypothetical protein
MTNKDIFRYLMSGLVVGFTSIGLYFSQNTPTMFLVASIGVLAFYFNFKK